MQDKNIKREKNKERDPKTSRKDRRKGLKGLEIKEN